VLAVIAVQLYQLGKVGLSREHVLNTLAVEVKSIRRKLKTVFLCNTIAERSQKTIGRFTIALPYRDS
jgi:hypothetical protein